jgi:hypothetical protein
VQLEGFGLICPLYPKENKSLNGWRYRAISDTLLGYG